MFRGKTNLKNFKFLKTGSGQFLGEISSSSQELQFSSNKMFVQTLDILFQVTIKFMSGAG